MFNSAEAFDRNIVGWNVQNVTFLPGAPPHLRRSCTHTPPGLRDWGLSPRRIRCSYPSTELLLGSQAPSTTPSA
jgi:hypothetical protein